MLREATRDLAARALVASLFALLSVNLLADFLRTGHITGLLLLVSEALIVILTVVRRRAQIIDRSTAAAVTTTLSIVGPPLLRAGQTPGLLPDMVTAIVSAVGLLLVIGGKMTLGRSFGIAPANRGVVARGPYTIVRHPIYASMFAMCITSAILLGRLPWWPIGIALFLAGIEIRIHVEDTLLRDRFGTPFEAWKMKIPAYLPLIR